MGLPYNSIIIFPEYFVCHCLSSNRNQDVVRTEVPLSSYPWLEYGLPLPVDAASTTSLFISLSVSMSNVPSNWRRAVRVLRERWPPRKEASPPPPAVVIYLVKKKTCQRSCGGHETRGYGACTTGPRRHCS
jgi:hypothetical protein